MHPHTPMRWLALLMLTIAAVPSQAARLSSSTVTLSAGQTSVVKVSRISGNLQLAVSDPAVASIVRSGEKITITALKAGTANLIATDRSGTTQSRITVLAPMKVSPTSASLAVGKSTTLAISNASGRVHISNTRDEVARASLSGSTVTITGRKAGSALVTISDSKTKVVVQITVVQEPPPVTGDASQGRLLASNCYQCHGTNGSGGFDSLRGSDEILEELREFASGREDPGGIMAAHSMGYTDAQMKAIADYLAGQ